jgi:hypothetical protein
LVRFAQKGEGSCHMLMVARRNAGLEFFRKYKAGDAAG